MDATILALLTQDGITNGAVYALLALALVLVFAVTRIIFLPQGEFLAWGALTLAALEGGQRPGTIWLLALMGVTTFIVDCCANRRGPRVLMRSFGFNVVYPAAMAALLWLIPVASLPHVAKAIIALALVVPMGPMLYRLAYLKRPGN